MQHLGVESALLTGKYVDCPLCQKRKKFRFDDLGCGRWICVCGAGDGFQLLQQLFGWSFKVAASKVEEVAGSAPVRPVDAGPSDESKLRMLRRAWAESIEVRRGDVVHRYMGGRGLRVSGLQNIRLHPGMTYRDVDGKDCGKFPVMLAKVIAPSGTGVSLHRTYLNTDGTRLQVDDAKKLMPGLGIAGAAVRLSGLAEEIGVAEGIETAVAASQLFNVPVWSCISAGGLESFVPPAGVKRVVVFGDNDASFTGQAAAYSLAKRMTLAGIPARVMLPEVVGADWCDVLKGAKQ
jgi:putative DNA primase/helicase